MSPSAGGHETRRIAGIDWLRAIMSIFVVAWHFAGGGRSPLFEEPFRDSAFTLSDFVNFHLFLLAVPTFMIVASYLFARAKPDAAHAARKARRVGALLLFWPTTLLVFEGGWQGFVASLPDTLGGWPFYVLTAGGTIFYFFPSLLLTYGLTCLAARLRPKLNVALLVSSVIALGLAPLVAIRFGWTSLCAFWSPINFLPYSFAGVVVLRLCGRDASPRRAFGTAAALAIGGCACAVAEWRVYPNAIFFPGQYVNFPTYTRPSVVAFSMALLIVSLRPDRGVPAFVAVMSRYALALYCLHMFLAAPMRLLVQRLGSGLPELGQAWTLIALTVVSSYLAARVLSVVWKDRLLF